MHGDKTCIVQSENSVTRTCSSSSAAATFTSPSISLSFKPSPSDFIKCFNSGSAIYLQNTPYATEIFYSRNKILVLTFEQLRRQRLKYSARQHSFHSRNIKIADDQYQNCCHNQDCLRPFRAYPLLFVSNVAKASITSSFTGSSTCPANAVNCSRLTVDAPANISCKPIITSRSCVLT